MPPEKLPAADSLMPPAGNFGYAKGRHFIRAALRIMA
jgi:hypothetical protein